MLPGDPFQHRCTALLHLDPFPVLLHLLGGACLGLPEDVRMTADQLLGLLGEHVAKRELARLLGDRRLQDDVQEQVPQLLAELGHVARVQRLHHFVRLLDETVAQ